MQGLYNNQISRRSAIASIGSLSVASGVAGCVGSGENKEIGGKVTIAAGSQVLPKADLSVLHDAGLPTDVEVEILTSADKTGERADNIAAILESKQPSPDLLMMDVGWAIPFIAQDSLLNLEENLSDSMLEDVRSNTFDSLIQSASHPKTGDLHAMPFFPDYPTMQYRKDLFREAGYSDTDFDEWATNPPSWGRWSSIVAEVQAVSGLEYGYVWQGDNYEGLSCCVFNEVMTAAGGSYFGDKSNLFGPVGDRPVTVDEPPAVDGVRILRDLIYNEDESEFDVASISPEAVLGWTEPDTDGQFVSASSAVTMRNWPYTISLAVDQWSDDKQLGVMPMPSGPDGSAHALGGWLLAVNPHSNNRRSALAVLEKFHSDSVQLEMLDGPGVLPHNPSLFMGDARDHQTLGPFMDALEFAGQNLIPRPVTSVWPDESTAIHRHVWRGLRGEVQPEAAMEDLAETLRSIESGES
jgi:ABC-type glycerol-3-phosphate transport system substrate-binding protein